MSKFTWWHEDPRELHIWKKLNAMSPEDREAKYGEVCREKVQKYGNIYFYKPHPHQLPVHSDEAKLINIHGQNSGGKSYNAAAWVAEEVTGFSQYRTIEQPPFGVKKIWIITTSFQIQQNSSQSLLFSNEYAPVRDVGLLPSLASIEAAGGMVVWEKGEKQGILKRVVFPNRQVEIEFKSMESRGFSMAGAAVDRVWVDEVCTEHVYNELVTRCLRKNGRLIMSYLVGGEPINKKIPGEWVVNDLYPQYLDDLEKFGHSEANYYFFEIEQNESLDPQQVKALKSLTTASERAWRFSPGGKFNIQAKGNKVYDAFTPDLHCRENLNEEVNEFTVLYRAWDLGYHRPSCTGFYIDKYNRVRILFSILGKQELLNDFIPKVQRLSTEVCPEVTFFYELIPHDGNRRYDSAPKSSVEIFRDNGLTSYSVIYIHKEESILDWNKYLQRLIRGQPAVLVDPDRASRVVSTMSLYTRDDETGEPLKNDYAHTSDNLKMIAEYLKREGALNDRVGNVSFVPSDNMYPSKSEPAYGE